MNMQNRPIRKIPARKQRLRTTPTTGNLPPELWEKVFSLLVESHISDKSSHFILPCLLVSKAWMVRVQQYVTEDNLTDREL